MTAPPPLSGETCIVQRTDLPHGEIDEELMALDAGNGEVLGVDRIGTRIWKYAADPISIDDLVSRLCEEFAEDEQVIRQDLTLFLHDMIDCGLLRVVR